MITHANHHYMLVLAVTTVFIGLHSTFCEATTVSPSPSTTDLVDGSETSSMNTSVDGTSTYVSPTTTPANSYYDNTSTPTSSSANSSYDDTSTLDSSPTYSSYDGTSTLDSSPTYSSYDGTSTLDSSPTYNSYDDTSTLESSSASLNEMTTSLFSSEDAGSSTSTPDESSFNSNSENEMTSTITVNAFESLTSMMSSTNIMPSMTLDSSELSTSDMTLQSSLESDSSPNTLISTTLASSSLSDSTGELSTTPTGHSTISGTSSSYITSTSPVNSGTVSMTSTSMSPTSVSNVMPSMSGGSSVIGSGFISSTPALETASLSSMHNASENSNASSINSTSSIQVSTTLMTSLQPSTSGEDTMSTIVPTIPATTTTVPTTSTTTPTTTTPRTTTLKYEPVPGDINAAIFKVSFQLTFNCSSFNKAEIEAYFKNGTGFLSVKLTPKTTTGSRTNTGSRRKRNTPDATAVYNVSVTVPATQIDSINMTTNEILTGLRDNKTINMSMSEIDNIVGQVATQTSDVCKATNYCPSGTRCPENSANKTYCYFLCDTRTFSDNGCGPHGNCYVEVGYNANEHVTKCSCVTDEFYQYGGKKCETREMTWQMILAIAGGCAGAIIVILVFVIIVTCVRKKRSNGYNKYSNGGDLHYMDLPQAHNRTSSQMYQGLGPSDDRTNSGRSQGYENKAYDYKDYIEGDSDLHYRTGAHATNGSRPTNGSRAITGSGDRDWNPDASAEVYAKLNTRFDDVNYQYNIKRAQLKTSGDNSDVRTGF